MRAIPVLMTLLSLQTFAIPVTAQRRDNVWYFGYHAGIDFNAGAPVPLTDGQTNVWEGTSSVCDPATGALLFYTDGVTVWNRNHTAMPNGSGLLGAGSSAQGALIVGLPGSPSIYYVFTAPQVEGGGIRTIGINYSIVDITADSGRGAVLQKNIPLLKPAAEKLQAIRHCNGRDYWILMVEWGTNRHHARLLTPTGLSATSVVSTVGPILRDNNSGSGYLVASPDGRRLGMALNTQQSVTLFDFSTATGIVSNPVDLDAGDGEYGIGFSPDNSKLYVSGTNGGTVVQYDLSNSSPSSIRASKTLLQRGGGVFEYGAFRIGPDGRLYMARSRRLFAAVIRNPNATGVACGYTDDGLNLGGAQGGLGFPNTPVDPPPGTAVNADAGPDARICSGEKAQLQASGGTTYRWSPTTGLSCSDCPNPIARPAVTTTYHVFVDEVSGCPGLDSVTVTVVACADTTLDYTYHMPDLCVGQTELIAVPFHHRWYQDTAVSIRMIGRDAPLFELDTAPPVVLTPLQMIYFPVVVRWAWPGLQKGIIQIVTSSGAIYHVGLEARVGGSIQSAFSTTAIPVRSAGAPYDTCITVTSTFYTDTEIRDTAWVSRTGSYRLTSPSLPILIPRRGSVQICLHIERAGAPGQDTLLLGVGGVDSCGIPYCFAHPIALGGTGSPPPTSGVEPQTGEGLRMAIHPNPVTTRGTVELATGRRERIRLRLLDAAGRELVVLFEGECDGHGRTIDLLMDRLPSGSYFLLLESGSDHLMRGFVIRR